MSAPLAFGLPVYNGERYIRGSLASLQSQDFADIEIIVSDNGSTDGTEEICREAAADDARIRYVRQSENRGGNWNFAQVLELSDSRLFSWMAVDDIKLPAFASSCIATLEAAGPGVVFSAPHTRLIDDDDVVFEELNDLDMGMDAATPHERVRNLYRSQGSHAMYGVIRRDALAKTHGIRSMLAADLVILTELLCQGSMVLSPEPTFLQRRNTTQASALGVNDPGWFVAGTKTRFAFPNVVTNVELYRAIAMSELGVAEKVRCWAQVAPYWGVPHWRAIAHDVANAAGINPQAIKKAIRG